MRNRISRKNLQWALFIVGLIILAFFLYRSGLFENLDVFLEINLWLFLLAFLVSVISIIIKVIRWQYLSREYGQSLSLYEASVVSISSLFFANITPGKIGDLYKAYYMKKRYAMNFLDGASMIFYERFYELLILFAVSLLVFVLVDIDNSTIMVLLLTLVILVGLYVLYSRFDLIFGLAKKFLIRLPYIESQEDLDIHISRIDKRAVFWVILISFASIFLEFVRLWLVALAFGYSVDFVLLSVFFCLSIIIGLVSQIPLGVGVMEGSLTFFLEKLDVPGTMALAIVIADRLISMYFALLIGFVFSKVSLDEMKGVES